MTPDVLMRAAEAAGIGVALLSDASTKELLAKLRRPKTRAIWEGMGGRSVQEADAWRLIRRLGDEELLLLFEDPPLAARFDRAEDVVHVIGELPQVVFYVVCSGGLVAFNDHDVLIASGTAERIIDEPERA